MTDAAGLIRSRGGHRAYATKIANETKKLLQEATSADDSQIKVIESDLEVNEALLADKLEELKVIDKEYADTITDDAAYNDEIVKAGDFNRTIYSAIVSIKRYFSSSTKPDTKPGNSSRSSSASSTSATVASVKLPKLNLQKYDGNPLLYQSFWDSFESAVHSKSIGDVEKFNYLKGLLEGKASLVVQGMSLTSGNYNEAIQLLKERFGDPQIIIQANMDALLSLVPVMNDDLGGLRKLCDEIEVHIRNLQQFGVQTQNYGPVLISIICSKLPNDVNLEISRKMPDGAWTIDTLFTALKREVIARERCVMSLQANSENEFGSSSTLFNGVRGGGQQNRGRGRGGRRNRRGNQLCIFCNGQHQSKSCRTVSSVEERRVIVRDKNLCFICLRSNHHANECLSKSKCNSCNGKHHDSICTNRSNDNRRGDNSGRSDGGSDGLVNRNNDGNGDGVGGGVDNGGQVTQNGGGSRSVTCCNLNSQSQCVLLQTARALVSDLKSKKISMARIIFDNCSQRSFIASSLVKKLQLPVVTRKPLTVNAFGKKEEGPQMLDVVHIKVSSRFDKSVAITAEVFVVPVICAPVTNQVINLVKENCLEFRNLVFADNSDESTTLEIDILIGANFYWEFLTGVTKRSGNLIASQSCLGWVLNGNTGTETLQNASVNVAAAHVLQVQSEEVPLQKQLRQFWEVEGIEESSPEEFDSTAFAQQIVRDDERYNVPLPWKPG